ncbi:MAG: Rid family detoxifying hydrolase [Candidatus Cloacimonadaceae bacterium]
MQAITTHKAPPAIGPYSQAVLKNNTLFISGQLGLEPTSEILPESFNEQAKRVFANLKAILEAADMSFSQVVKVTIFLADMNDFPQLNELYAQFFSVPYPARETIQAAKLPKDAKIEISLIAMK